MKTKADIAADLSHEEALQYLIEFYREKSVLEDRGTV